MQSIILAAGMGNRISSSHSEPKILLKVGQHTLLERHLSNLRALGVIKIVICLGYKQELVIEEIRKLGMPEIEVVSNMDFQLGSTVSLWKASASAKKNCETLLLDADVLYHPEIIRRLAKAKSNNCLLIDRNFDVGDEPVKVCIKDGRIIEFRKMISPNIDYDTIGESVGFFKFSANDSDLLFDECRKSLASGRVEDPHEEVIRECILHNKFEIGFEDISGLPWIEIDFPEDIEKAEQDILPLTPFVEFTQ